MGHIVKQILFFIIIFIVQQSLFAQLDIVGKVSFYKYLPHENDRFASSTDASIDRLNTRKHHIEIVQNGAISTLIVDSTGVFTTIVNSKDSLTITVNKKANVLKKVFRIAPSQLTDTLLLQISDRKLSNYRDSIRDPAFYNSYSERQAILDFKNGKAQILANGSFLSDKALKSRENMEAQYHFTYRNIFGCMTSHSEIRIAYKYNQMMIKLIGIEDPWK